MNLPLHDKESSDLGMPPFYELFQAVKACDRDTGHATVDVQSYFLLLETVLKGYMITSQEELLALCEKLWLKPYHRQSNSLNKEILAKLVTEKLAAFVATETPASAAAPGLSGTAKSTNKTPLPPTAPVNPDTKTVPPSAADVALTEQQGDLNLYLTNTPVRTGTAATEFDEHASKFLQKTYLTKGRYLPVNPRRLAQSFRSYRFVEKGMWKTAVDIDATISHIAKNRFFERFEYKAAEQFTTAWTLLIDHSSSMAAFEPFCNEIVRMVVSGADNRGTVYYFKNQPATYVFYDRQQTRSIPWLQVTAGKKLNLLIISDAGAARGTNNEERIMAAVKMLRQLQQHNVAWLNPMPRIRWKNTSAEMIAEFTDMFEPGEGDSDGISNIVRLFKSKIQMSNV
jgi:uncharacterized protein